MMANTTYYVALPFVRNEEGDLVTAEPKEAQSDAGAKRMAAVLAMNHAGALAFSRSGDPDVGEFADAVIIARYGEVADELLQP
jgi:hypothetical protein